MTNRVQLSEATHPRGVFGWAINAIPEVSTAGSVMA